MIPRSLVVGWNWQIIMTPALRVQWVWASDCECGRGHLIITFYAGPFMSEVAW